MSKIKSLLLASSVCIATVCINFPAHATERHLLEQTVSYEELGNVLRYRQSWVDYPAYTDRKSWKEKTAPEMRDAYHQERRTRPETRMETGPSSDYLAFNALPAKSAPDATNRQSPSNP